MHKIKRVSTFFRIIFQIIFVLLPIVFAYAWTKAPEPSVFLNHLLVIQTVPEHLPIFHHLTGQTRLYGFLVTMIPVSIAMLGLYFLIRLFRLYEKGVIFGLRNIRYIRNIGYVLLASQFLTIIYDLLISFVLTVDNPPGHRMITATLTSLNLGILLTSLLVILISWIMSEASKLSEEQKLTI